MRGRPERYNKAELEIILQAAKDGGLNIKEYCASNNHVYISVIVALKRHGLSPRACKVSNYTATDALNRVDNDCEVALENKEAV